MTTPTRIYHVTENGTGKYRLIRAVSQAQAIRYAAQTSFGARVATQDDIVFAMSNGTAVENAGPATGDLFKEGSDNG